MFFKKRRATVPEWWLEIDRRAKEYKRRLADYLARRAERIRPGRLKLYFAMLVWLMMSLDVYLMVRPGHRTLPEIGWPEGLVIRKPPRPIMQESFDRYIDSLRRDRVVDSLLRCRPGLEDTLRMIEELSEVGWRRVAPVWSGR